MCRNISLCLAHYIYYLLSMQCIIPNVEMLVNSLDVKRLSIYYCTFCRHFLFELLLLLSAKCTTSPDILLMFVLNFCLALKASLFVFEISQWLMKTLVAFWAWSLLFRRPGWPRLT